MNDMLPCVKTIILISNEILEKKLKRPICVFMIVTCGKSTNISNSIKILW